jgi:3',5'-cyclic AMP phosphodiesterase CpdA
MTRTIAHISDLHFGRVEPSIADALLRELHAARPSIVVVSGDFTQRARRNQYRAAAVYLRQLPTPQIVVPGNHDIPLFDVVRRFLFPLTRYRRFISENLQPLWTDGELLVLGINTARSFTRTGGHITPRQLELARQQLGKSGDGLFKVVVTHHPFIPAPDKRPKDIVIGAQEALETFESCGVNLLLSGHLHLSYCGDLCVSYPTMRRSMIAVQAGTATSTRRREEPNEYNLITIRDRHVEIEARSWDGQGFGTVVKSEYSFV